MYEDILSENENLLKNEDKPKSNKNNKNSKVKYSEEDIEKIREVYYDIISYIENETDEELIKKFNIKKKEMEDRYNDVL